MNEQAVIRRLLAPFARDPLQRNAPFECDAELLEIGGDLWGITIDEFSPGEDCFPDADALLLGRNLATATLSDLFACGAQPAFFLQAICLPLGARSAFADQLARGISETLEAAGCHLCGGDLGQADTWRFTGVAMGRVRNPAAVTRRINHLSPVELWISGPLGDANLAAVGALPTLTLEPRIGIAKWLAANAAACIDTSGGLWDSLWMLAQVNPNFRFELDLADVPLADGVERFCRSAKIPSSVALLGGAGEYELLFAVESSIAQQSRENLLRMGATRIGRALPDGEPGFFVRGDESSFRPAPACPDARAMTREAYFAAVVQTARTLEGTP